MFNSISALRSLYGCYTHTTTSLFNVKHNNEKIQTQYPDAIHCSIIDLSDGCGAKLELTIVSNKFDNMPLLKRHREVQNHLKEKGLFDEIHALQIKAWTGEQWEKKKGGV